jgi:ubiquinone/menaquinone biosynthesis C-methylase UbiE
VTASDPYAAIATGYDAIAELMYEDDDVYADALTLLRDCHGRVLDVGCGQGRFLRALAATHPGLEHLSGCDISPRLCEIARESVPGASIVVDNATTLAAFPDGMFDFVVSIATLEHTIDHAGAIAAAHRVLARGGVYVVFSTNRDWLRYRAWASRHTQVEPVDHYWFKPDELLGLIRQAGFQVEGVRGGWALVRGGRFHSLENAVASLMPRLGRKMKLIGVRARRPG